MARVERVEADGTWYELPLSAKRSGSNGGYTGVFKPAEAKAASASAIWGLAGRGPGNCDSTTLILFFAHCCNLRIDLRAYAPTSLQTSNS